MKIKVYLDDWRIAPEDWVQAWNTEEIISLFNNNNFEITEISLDNDLGVDDSGNILPDGVSFVRYFIENSLFCEKIYFQTANSVAKERMVSDLLNAQKHGIISKDIEIITNRFPTSKGNRGEVYKDIF